MKFLTILVLLFGLYAKHHSTPIILNGHEILPPPPLGARVETEHFGYIPEEIEFFEGDMILTEDQKEWLEGPSGMRKANNDHDYLWPNAVVQFRLSPSSVDDREALKRGMQYWSENSCVTFEEVPEGYRAPHLIFSGYGGCFSHVGRMFRENGQLISIGRSCKNPGTVAHELGHALGFYHEQSRPDRDDYVVVLYQNLNPNSTFNFKVMEHADSLGIPYDLGSIMHYGRDGFSINGKNTLVTRDPLKHFVIGQRQSLSFADLKLGNLLYNCSSKCGANKCLNDGYTDQYCQCKCPPGYSGNRCQNSTPVRGLTCGGAVNHPTTISSPNHPNNYPAGTQCVWHITAPRGRRVRASFGKFELSPRWAEKNQCFWDFLELRSDDLYNGEINELSGVNNTSAGETMVLILNADFGGRPGFEAQISFV